MQRIAHIVTHDVPYPADYGGVVDVLNKIIYLAEKENVHIILHCFTQGRPQVEELKKWCKEVNYYKRNKNILGFSLKLPFIVKSRANKQLIHRLMQDEHPIIFDGMHTTYPLYKHNFKNRKIIVRCQNVETLYYKYRGKNAYNIFEKIWCNFESFLLKRYEKQIAKKAKLLTISSFDAKYFANNFQAEDVKFMPTFLHNNNINTIEGKGSYCLYHGNLEIEENENAAKWLIKNVFLKLDIPFVIAGKNPSESLLNLAEKSPYICVVANPSNKELADLHNKAHINILPSKNNTGIKIKILHALQYGRFCLTNFNGIKGSGLEKTCEIAEKPIEFTNRILQLMQIPFTSEMINERKYIFETQYNPKSSAKNITDYFWS